MSELLTGAALAARLGVQREAVAKAVRAGRLDRCRRGSRFDFDVALHEWNAGRGHAPTADGSIAAERRRLLRAKADAQERENQRRDGQLVSAASVALAWAGEIKRVQTTLLGLPSRAKQRCPHLTPEDLVVLQGLVHDALAELAGREEGAA